VNLGEQLVIVERALQTLIRDWERFFAGDLRVPPHDDVDRLGRRLRMLAESSAGSRVERYRLEQTQHRFATYSQNWERMLREREEGRTRTAAVPRRLIPEQPGRRPNGSAAVAVDEQGSDSLYDRYVAAKRAHGLEVSLDRATFESQLAEQRSKLQAKVGGEVRFDVLVEDGKVRLAARMKRARSNRE
jgi:hypothetical protein